MPWPLEPEVLLTPWPLHKFDYEPLIGFDRIVTKWCKNCFKTSPYTVYCQTFAAHNIRGFGRFDLNHENYAREITLHSCARTCVIDKVWERVYLRSTQHRQQRYSLSLSYQRSLWLYQPVDKLPDPHGPLSKLKMCHPVINSSCKH